MTYRIGNCIEILKSLDPGQFHTCITSPPYWGLRDYGHDDQLGLEASPEAYVDRMVQVFDEVRRVLRDDGTLWLNLGDSYASNLKGSGGPSKKQNKSSGHRFTVRTFDHGLKPKDLVGIPWRVAFALQRAGWYLRSDIIWAKPNPMPESVTDRPTKSHEYLFLLSKSPRYYYDAEAIKEPLKLPAEVVKAGFGGVKSNGDRRYSGNPYNAAKLTGRNKRSVWNVATRPYSGAHFAVFPPALIKPCILAGCPEGGTVLDPFLGSGTTGRVAMDLGRNWFGIELNPDYAPLIDQRTAQTTIWAVG